MGMDKDTYIEYLETVVISLLNERNTLDDLPSTDKNAPPFAKGFTFSPINIIELINKKRSEKHA